MFRASAETSDPGAVPEWLNEGKASGVILLCLQSALVFGSNRRTPVRSRPVVLVKRDGNRLAVLPCTTHAPQRPGEFFELTASRTFWIRPSKTALATRAFYRYEVVASGEIGKKIGTLTQNGRVDLMHWLQERHVTRPTHGQQ